LGSGGQAGVVGEFVEGGLVGAGGRAQLRWPGWAWVDEFGQRGSQEVVVGVGEEQRVLQSGVGDLVSAGAGDAGDQPVHA